MLKHIIAAFFLLTAGLTPGNAAVTAGSVHYVYTTGAAGNGGCFDPTVTGFATNGAATSATSSAPVFSSATYNFVAGDVGARVFIKSGTDWVPGWYTIASVAANAATLTATIGTATLWGTTSVAAFTLNTATGAATTASPTGATWGIDYSDQAGSEFSYTDLVIGVGTDTATSVAQPLAVNHIGNCFNVTAGTGFTVQRVVLNSVTATVGSFLTTGGVANLGTTGSTGGQATVGGARGAGIQAAEVAMVAGNVAFVKATASYGVTATQSYGTAGTISAPISYMSYTSIVGDNGPVTVNRTSGTISVFNVTGAYRRFKGFYVTNAISKGWVLAGAHTILENCRSDAFTSIGFDITGSADNSTLINTLASNGTSAATYGYAISGSASSITLIGAVASAGVCGGFLFNSTTQTRSICRSCISANHTAGGGTTADGFKVTSTAADDTVFMSCVSYGNAGAGLLYSGAVTADWTTVMNSLFINNGTYGINSDTTNYGVSGKYPLVVNFNGFYNNTSGARNNFPVGDNDKTLTGDPFTNGAGLNFSLNNTAGAGAVARAGGYPGVTAGGTGYADIGALQHQDSGGASTQKAYSFVARTRPAPNSDLWPLIHPTFEAGIYWPLDEFETGALTLLILAIVGVRLILRKPPAS